MDDTDIAYVTTRGWQDPASMVGSYRNLESHKGVPEERLVTIPTDPDDVEGWGKVHTKLGRPGTPEEYEVPALEAQEGRIDLTPDFRIWAHEAGLSQRQMAGLVGKFNDKMSGLVQSSGEESDLATEQGLHELQREWGQAYDQNVGIAIGAAQKFGLDQETIAGIERGLGEAGAAKLLHKIGMAVGEGKAPTGQEAGGHGLKQTPGEAKQKISELHMDAKFMQQYRDDGPGHKEANALMESLFKTAYPPEE